MKKFIMTILLLCLFLFFLYKYFFSYTEKNTFTNQDFYIDDYTSMVDMDQDGVDDQTDIFQRNQNIRVSIIKVDILQIIMVFVLML